MGDMQSTAAGSDGEGLHERKSHQRPSDISREDDIQNNDPSSEESRKEKRTFGRTPDGVGETIPFSALTLLSLSICNRPDAASC